MQHTLFHLTARRDVEILVCRLQKWKNVNCDEDTLQSPVTWYNRKDGKLPQSCPIPLIATCNNIIWVPMQYTPSFDPGCGTNVTNCIQGVVWVSEERDKNPAGKDAVMTLREI